MGCAVLPLPAAPAGESLPLLREQAAAGDPWAQLNLGAAYDNGLQGLPADAVQAVRWYRAAAEQGLAEAQFNLAHCLATGHGTARDYVTARTWMRRAALQGVADAQFLLGVMLDQGMGGDKDADIARDWLQQAAGQGHAQAIAYLRGDR